MTPLDGQFATIGALVNLGVLPRVAGHVIRLAGARISSRERTLG